METIRIEPKRLLCLAGTQKSLRILPFVAERQGDGHSTRRAILAEFGSQGGFEAHALVRAGLLEIVEGPLNNPLYGVVKQRGVDVPVEMLDGSLNPKQVHLWCIVRAHNESTRQPFEMPVRVYASLAAETGSYTALRIRLANRALRLENLGLLVWERGHGPVRDEGAASCQSPTYWALAPGEEV